LPMRSSNCQIFKKKKKAVLNDSTNISSINRTISSSKASVVSKGKEELTSKYLESLVDFFHKFKGEAEKKIIAIPMKGLDFKKRQIRQTLRRLSIK